MPVGEEVGQALARARVFRQQIGKGAPPELGGPDPGNVADTLYAACQSLMDECLDSPRVVLEDAVRIRDYSASLQWAEDELEERTGFFCTLTFIAWRAARILGLTLEAQKYETAYAQAFRASLQWVVAESVFGALDGWDPSAEGDFVEGGAEAAFQSLLYLHDCGEATPRSVGSRAALLYRAVRDAQGEFPPDLSSFLLGDAALLAGIMARHTGHLADAEEWATLAEGHFRADANPKPGLCRVMFLRLTVLYERGDCGLVVKAARSLDQSFSNMGMLEDHVKCRILRAAALKIAGQPEEALAVLEPVRAMRDRIRPALFGWVLLQSGDLQQIYGNEPQALEELVEACRLLQEGKQFTGLADVKIMISSVFRSHGMLNEALQLLQSSCEEHVRLGMRSLEARNRMLIAETYLAMGRAQEAEREIRQVLPILEEQSMLPDAIVAANILAEALKQQRGGTKSFSDRVRPRE